MTIGSLSRRTGVPVKALRLYEDLGLIYTVGRSEGNFRQFGEESLWCVAVVGRRALGLTIAAGCPPRCQFSATAPSRHASNNLA